ncbi:pectinesterase inhibitor 10-like [Nicotiana sylvestris]|uniref:pectinesterase inhibitor 10-like n=1 Tax=Nicotiana sylvestris TaxID=4096 RepID=UPI00388C3F75
MLQTSPSGTSSIPHFPFSTYFDDSSYTSSSVYSPPFSSGSPLPTHVHPSSSPLISAFPSSFSPISSSPSYYVSSVSSSSSDSIHSSSSSMSPCPLSPPILERFTRVHKQPSYLQSYVCHSSSLGSSSSFSISHYSQQPVHGPFTYSQLALVPKRKDAMRKEFEALEANET